MFMNNDALFSVKEIAGLIGGEILGNPEVLIYRLNRIEDAIEGELTFYTDKSFDKYLTSTLASCIIVPLDFDFPLPDNISLIKVEKPYLAIVKILQYLDSLTPKKNSFVHPTAIIDRTSTIDKSAFIGPNCIIGKNCKISENVVLHSNINLYDNVEISKNTFLHSGVICCNDTDRKSTRLNSSHT